MFLHVSVILFTGAGLCPGVSVWGVSVQGGSGRGVSVQGVSVRGSLSRRPPLGQETPPPGQRPPYGNVRAIRILLECILVCYLLSTVNVANKAQLVFTARTLFFSGTFLTDLRNFLSSIKNISAVSSENQTFSR